MLMPMHPLHKELRSLQEHSNALRGIRQPDLAGQIQQPWESRVIVGPVLTDYPTQRLAQWREGWWEGLPRVQGGPLGQLPRDLEARLAWRQQQIHQQTREQLRQAEAEGSQRLAKLRIKAAEQFQKERRNLGLDLSLSDAEAQQRATERRAEIWQQIEQQLAREAKRGQAKLQRLREKLKQQEDQAVAATRQELLSRDQQRYSQQEATVRSAQQQLRQMVEEIGEPDWLLPQPVTQPGQSAPTPGTAGELRQQAFAEYEALRAQQIERLTAHKVALTATIAAATRQAAQRVAWEEDIDLHLLPDQSVHGVDVTDVIATRLNTMWTKPESSDTRRGR